MLGGGRPTTQLGTSLRAPCDAALSGGGRAAGRSARPAGGATPRCSSTRRRGPAPTPVVPGSNARSSSSPDLRDDVRARAAVRAPRPGGRGCGASCRPSRSTPPGSPPLSNQKTRLCSRNRPRIERTATVSDRPGTPGRSAQMPRISSSTRHALLRGEVERVDHRLVDHRVGLDPDPGGPAGPVVGDLLVDLVDQARRARSRAPRAAGRRSRLRLMPAEVVEQVATSSPISGSVVSRPRSS